MIKEQTNTHSGNENIKITVIDHNYSGKMWYFESVIYEDDFPMINKVMERTSKYWGSKSENKKFYYVYKDTLNKMIKICMEEPVSYDLIIGEDVKKVIDYPVKEHYIIEVLDGDILNVANSMNFREYSIKGQ